MLKPHTTFYKTQCSSFSCITHYWNNDDLRYLFLWEVIAQLFPTEVIARRHRLSNISSAHQDKYDRACQSTQINRTWISHRIRGSTWAERTEFVNCGRFQIAENSWYPFPETHSIYTVYKEWRLYPLHFSPNSFIICLIKNWNREEVA